MSTITPSRVKPEDEELAKKRLELAKLESELADRELYVATLRSELASFERQYLKIVGTRYAELDEINAQIAEQLARQRSDDAQSRDAAKKARRQADESRSAAEASAQLMYPLRLISVPGAPLIPHFAKSGIPPRRHSGLLPSRGRRSFSDSSQADVILCPL